MLKAIATLAAMLPATPALAHPGEHGHMSLTELVAHYAEPDHLAFLALTVLVGVLAYRAGRRTEARKAAARMHRGPKP
jgi:hydrogenase/urease accessory protein HupE